MTVIPAGVQLTVSSDEASRSPTIAERAAFSALDSCGSAAVSAFAASTASLISPGSVRDAANRADGTRRRLRKSLPDL